MSLVISKYEFDGPITQKEQLHARAGIYMVLRSSENESDMLAYGFTKSVAGVCSRFLQAHEDMCVAVLYIDESERRKIEGILQEIKLEYGSASTKA